MSDDDLLYKASFWLNLYFFINTKGVLPFVFFYVPVIRSHIPYSYLLSIKKCKHFQEQNKHTVLRQNE